MRFGADHLTCQDLSCLLGVMIPTPLKAEGNTRWSLEISSFQHCGISFACLSRDRSHKSHLASPTLSCRFTLQRVTCIWELATQSWSELAAEIPQETSPARGQGGWEPREGDRDRGQGKSAPGGDQGEGKGENKRNAWESRHADIRKWRGQARENIVF